jgi:hypothetical protein
MTLKEQITQEIAREMAAQMDFDIIADLLGWTRIELAAYDHNVLNWLDKHCRSEYQRHKSSFIFRDPKDASHFILKWL